MPMLALFKDLFLALEQKNVGYAIWKNMQELPDALAGNSDIDLFIYPESGQPFLAVLHDLRFIRLLSHKSYPCVEHYYGLDSASGKFAHLHCYYRLVTGESHIKQYVVPVEPYLTVYPARLNDLGYREMHPLLLKKLNIFRRKIKVSCLPGALLFYRERQGYQQEKELTTHAIAMSGDTGTALLPSGWLADIQESATTVGECLDGLRYRYRYQHWNRFRPLSTPFHRYLAIVARLLGKLRRQKKVLPTGVSLNLSTADPTTTHELDRLICDWMAKHFSIRSMVDQRFVLSLAKVCAGLEPATSPVARSRDSHPAPSLRSLAGLVWLAWRWRRRVRQSVAWSTSGFIVIWDDRGVEQVRLALAGVTDTLSHQSGLTRRVLQSCQSCLKIEPAIDCTLIKKADNYLVTSNDGDTEGRTCLKNEVWKIVSSLQH